MTRLASTGSLLGSLGSGQTPQSDSMGALLPEESLEGGREGSAHLQLHVPIRPERHHRYAVQVLGEMLEQKERALVRPVEVVE